MMYWLLVIIVAYLFFGFASLCDKLVLNGKANPKTYTFYVGISSILVILIIPFVRLGFPGPTGFIFTALDAIVHLAGMYAMFLALRRFDVSRVVATIGATQPIFIFILTWLFWGPQLMPLMDILAFILLLIGSIVISIEKNIKITGDYVKITIFSSIMFSSDYIFSKFVYLNQPFLQGIIWIRMFVFLFALLLLIGKNSRKEIFSGKIISNKKKQTAFLCAQASGWLANFLQSFAISLAPIAFLATVNSLRGIQYIFLFLMTLFISIFLPKLLKEKLSRRIVLQKVISIFIIAVGLAMLVIY